MNARNVCSVVAFVLAGAVAVIAGCSDNKASSGATAQASPSVMNSKCPFSGHGVAAGATADYKGKTVGFCCKDCATKWAGMSDADRDAALAKVTK